MTGREAKEVEAFAGDVDGWWTALGRGARDRWSAWLAAERDALRWDPEAGVFTT